MSIASIKGLINRVRGRNSEPFIAPPEAFASHLPILIGVGGMLQVRTVLELGCGTFSTPTFLNRRFFPELEELSSLETDRAWIEKTVELINNDPRWTPTVVDGSVANAVADVDFERYDLVMVDDSHTYAERARTIEAIAARKPASGLYLIHDFESILYQHAARPFLERFTFDALSPNTGANWNHRTISVPALVQLNKKIRTFAQNLKPTNVNAWYSVLRNGEN